MRRVSIAAGTLLVLLNISCGGGGPGSGVSVWPTSSDIDKSLADIVRSVSGDWIAQSQGSNPIRLDFKLQEGANGQVSGSGTMKEGSAATAVPITVTGTFQRPVLTLAFEGMVYESKAVKGSTQGSYTTVGGISSTLTLTAPGYSREIPVLLQETLN